MILPPYMRFPALAIAIALFLGFMPGTEAKAAIVTAKINLSAQRMQIYINGKRRYSWPVSTGKRGWRTPPGVYHPLATYRHFYSRKWHMSLPYLVFFHYTGGSMGLAIHGTSLTSHLGRPASHGCIRLHTGNAAKFYSLVKRYGSWNTSIIVHR